MEAVILPDEILSMVCAELGQKLEFGALYNCARSSRSLADAAIRTMYQNHEASPAFSFTEDDTRSTNGTWDDSQELFRKWTILWRSIISSSLEPIPTYKPYCHYLHILDFRNLSAMLESGGRFRSEQKSFYAKPLSRYKHLKREGRIDVVDEVATINHIGETVVPKARLLEEISGYLRPGFLSRWVAQSPHLKRMTLYRGDALINGVGKTIASTCEHFDTLSIMNWRELDADEVFATFLDELNPNTLRYLSLISFNEIGRRAFESLGRHSTLKELKLSNLSREAIENLNALKHCTQIEILSLEDSGGSVRLEELNNDAFVDVIVWLSSCTKLRDITIRKFFDGAAILAAAAVAPLVRWTKLCLEGYTVRNASSASFHTALSEQKDLESIFLSGNGEDTSPQDLEIMVSSLCGMPKLKELILRQVSDEFDMTHISNLVLNLPLLEEFWTSGGELSSDILPLLADLRNLKNLTMFALTQFSLDSILDFIQRLDPEKQNGFSFSLMAVDPNFALKEDEQQLVNESIRAHVDGRFGESTASHRDGTQLTWLVADFVPWRDAESSDSEDD